MAIKTNKSDVIANFVRYHGRQPNQDELKKGGLIEYLMTKSPKEVESLLAKNSPITGGKLWADYQKTKTAPAPAPSVPSNLNTTPLGKSGVNALFKQYYGRDATQAELDYWSNKSDAELRPKLIPNSATELAKNKPQEPKKEEPKKEEVKSGAETAGGGEDKNIYKDPNSNDLYYKVGNQFYKIKDIDELKDLVFNKGYQDTRLAVPAGTDLGQYKSSEQVATEEEEKAKVTTAEDQARLDSAYAIIDQAVKAGTLPPDLAEMYKEVIKNYPPGVEFEAKEILDTFKKIKDETIDPYFKELADVAINDVKYAYGLTEASRERELETERATAGENIRQAKSGLEKAGMTFTGQGIEELGKESAYAREGGAMPTQTSFGGGFYEGTVNQANRLLASSHQARYNEAIQSLGRGAESYLGTAGASALGIPYTPSGTNLTGQLTTQKQAKYGATLQDIINQYRAKQVGLEDIQFNF